MKELIGMIIAIGFPLCGVAAIIYLAITGPRNRKQVDVEFFSAYVGALSQGKYAEAWSHYDADLQAQKPLPAFTAHYQNLVKAHGPLKSHAIYSARSTFAGPEGFTVDITLQFEQTGIHANYELVRDASGTLRVHNSGSRHGLYRRQGLPW